MNAQTITINKTEYTVVKVEAIDAVQYPNRARYNRATVYLKVAKGSNLYAAAQRHDGTYSNVYNTGIKLSELGG
jgi:hypothetical protein